MKIKIDTDAGPHGGSPDDVAAWLARWQPSRVLVVCPYCIAAGLRVEPPGGGVLWRDDQATRDVLHAVAKFGRASCCGVDVVADPVPVDPRPARAERCGYMVGKGNQGSRCTRPAVASIVDFCPRVLYFCARHARLFQREIKQ